MSILLIILIVLLLCGTGYGFHAGNHGLGGTLGVIVVILIVLLLLGKL